MSTMEKSDLPKVARKRANKAAPAAAEFAERRGRAKENAELQSTVRTQSREAVSQAQARIREAVSRNRQGKLTALLHHISVDILRASFFGLKKSAAPGVDVDTFAPERHLQGVRDFEAPQRRYNGASFGDLGKDGIRARRPLVFEKPAQRQRGVKNQAHSRPSLMRSLMLLRPPSVAPSLMPRMAAAAARASSRLNAL